MSEFAWVVDGLAQFVHSPMWTIPVNNFIDEKCIFFDADNEMKLEYTPIHKEFQEIIDRLLTTFIDELGVSLTEALEAVHKSEDHSNGSLLEYITYLDNFISFKKLMEKRNVELELEAIRELEKHNFKVYTCDNDASNNDVPSIDADLEAALAASRLAAEKIMKEAELEDLELQRALALSLAFFEKEHNAKQDKLTDAESNDQANNMKIQKEELEKKMQQKDIEVMQARKNNLNEAQAKVAAIKDHTTSLGTSATVSTSKTDANAPDVVRLSSKTIASDAAQVTGKLPSLAPIGRHGGFSTLTPLPSITMSFHQLKEESSKVSADSKAECKKDLGSEGPNSGSIEEFKARQAEIMRQRDLLVAKKKAERNQQLQESGSLEVSAKGVDNADKMRQLTVEIARRFRADIVSESTK